MEKFCDFITKPEWWSVIATIIAAIVAAWITNKLGKRQNELQQQQLKIQERQNELQEQQVQLQEQQNKLQEQQIRQQEYALYRRMYTRVFELDFFNKTMLHRIVAILTSNEDNKLRLKLLNDAWQEYEKLSKEYSECTIDMELKQCGTGLDAKLYYDALQASSKVVQMFRYFIEHDFLIFSPSLAYSPLVEDPNASPQQFIGIILQLFRGNNSHRLERELMAHASIVERTKQSQLMATIKERITSNDTK